MEFIDLGIKVDLTRREGGTTCPKCSGNRKKKNDPCLHYNNEDGNRWWRCHHCGFSGNLEMYEKFDKVRQKAGIPANMKEVKTYTPEVNSYLIGRGLHPRILLGETIYEKRVKDSIYLRIPVYIGQTLVNVKTIKINAIDGENKYFSIKKDDGAIPMLLGLRTLEFVEGQPRKLVITEGQWDWLSYKMIGEKNAVSVPDGAPGENVKNIDTKLAWMNHPHVVNLFKTIDEFVLSFDDDGPGHKLKEILAEKLGKARCRVVQYPKGYKDINEVLGGNQKKGLIKLGIIAAKECLSGARPYPIRGIIKPSMVKAELDNYRKYGFQKGLVGSEVNKKLYDLFSIRQNLLIVMTGAPGSGKSTVTRWLLTDLIKANPDKNMKWAMFTPENRPASREVAKIAQALTGMSIKRSDFNYMGDAKYDKIMNFIEKHFSIIGPDHENFESFGGRIKKENSNALDSLFEYLIYLKKTEGTYGYVIDAWNKMDHQMAKYESETNYISRTLDRILSFNEQYNLACILIAHPTKLKIDEKSRNYKLPSLYDISGSAAWNSKADIGIVIGRDRYVQDKSDMPDNNGDMKYIPDKHAPTLFIVEKHRYEELGDIGRVELEMVSGGGFVVSGSGSRKEGGKQKEIKTSKSNELVDADKVFYDEVLEELSESGDDLPF